LSWSGSGVAETNFERLCREAEPEAYALLRRADVPPEDAEDLLHDCLVRLLELNYEVRDPVAWLLSALRYQVLMYRRAESAHVAEQLGPMLVDSLAAPDAVDIAVRLDLGRELARLSVAQRELLSLRFLHEFRPVDIARLKGCSTRNVRKRTALCLQMLRTSLAPAGGPPPCPTAS
jgi:RNA polymerase sigma factor (sigma-70 family)